MNAELRTWAALLVVQALACIGRREAKDAGSGLKPYYERGGSEFRLQAAGGLTGAVQGAA